MSNNTNQFDLPDINNYLHLNPSIRDICRFIDYEKMRTDYILE